MTWVHNGSPELDHLSSYKTILGVCISLSILTSIVVTLRGVTRGFVLRVLGADDYITFFGAVCGVIYAGLAIGQSRYGLGLPLVDRPKADLDKYSKINYAGRPIYMLGILSFKVALCFAYLRIMKSSSHRVYRMITWTVMILCIVGHLAGTFILIFQCSPTRKSWEPQVPGSCLPNDSTFYALAAVTIAFDVIIFFLPIPLLLGLNINLRRKLGLVFVFLLGLLTTVCSILRMVQIGTIAKTGNSTLLVLWGVVELFVGIILTCLPTIAPLIPYFRQAGYYGGHSGGRPGGRQAGEYYHTSKSHKLSNLGSRLSSRVRQDSDAKYLGGDDLGEVGMGMNGVKGLDAGVPNNTIKGSAFPLNDTATNYLGTYEESASSSTHRPSASAVMKGTALYDDDSTSDDRVKLTQAPDGQRGGSEDGGATAGGSYGAAGGVVKTVDVHVDSRPAPGRAEGISGPPRPALGTSVSTSSRPW